MNWSNSLTFLGAAIVILSICYIILQKWLGKGTATGSVCVLLASLGIGVKFANSFGGGVRAKLFCSAGVFLLIATVAVWVVIREEGKET